MIKIAVVGVGHLGRWHIKNVQTLADVELVGFYDTDRQRSAQIVAECQTTAFESLEQLLDNSDAVSIVVPTSAHYKVAKAALERGVHVFCEKPFMQTIAEADEIIALAKANHLVLQVGHIERFNPALAGIADLDIKPLFIESHRIAPFNPRGTDVAVILDLMIHDIDIILSMVNSTVEKIDASGAPILTNTIDIANARLQFASGCVANITASRVSHKQLRKIRIFQQNTYISIDFLENQTEIYSLADNVAKLPEEAVPIAELVTDARTKKIITYRQIDTQKSNALFAELQAFTHSIKTGSEPAVSGDAGKQALAIALKIEKQIQTGLEKVL